jgi:hypothetical protein
MEYVDIINVTYLEFLILILINVLRTLILLPSGIWHGGVQKRGSNVSEETTASIFKSDEWF